MSRFGSWVLMVFAPRERIRNESIKDDRPMPKAEAFLVDTDSNKVIERRDWQSVMPFYQAMVKYIRNNKARLEDESERRDDYNGFAEARSAIAYGHDRYRVGSWRGTKCIDPELELSTTPTFRYDVVNDLRMVGVWHVILISPGNSPLRRF